MKPSPTLPYGSWPSPISVEMAVGSSRGLSEPRPDGADIYLLESRPEEAGRVVLLRGTPDGGFTDMAPGLNVRSRVHEYGGGAYVVRDGVIVFSEFADNRLLLKRTPEAAIEELVTDPALRFADMAIDAARDGGPARVGCRSTQPPRRGLLGGGNAAGDSQRSRLLLGPAAQPRRFTSRLADLGLPADAL